MYKVFNSACFLFFSASLILACSNATTPSGSASNVKSGQNSVASPPCIVYKTKSDYSKNIPVILSDDKTRIVSYPDVKDIYFKERLAYPSVLDHGFFLDNRGISPNVAFLSITYEQYSKMDKTPSSTELFELIIDKDPLVEMFQCGNRSKYSDSDIENELNKLISSGNINTCTKLK
jgi:hypothetical protein